ncbi:hypothetical protein TWF788_004357 [Orbilia oligospora]|uniref:Uncharacterized protein n=1 Tax=Orbilia oligospora TaxID=2813651 RepID=A0A7C8PZR9_ORBOL|nr:hypothetical protein TWF788_004357 [Orbilia oligospora]
MHDIDVFDFIDFALFILRTLGYIKLDEKRLTRRMVRRTIWIDLEAYRALEFLAQQFEESVKFFQYPEHRKDGKPEGTTEQPDINVSPPAEGSRTKLYRASTLERATRFYDHRTGEINEYHLATLRGDLDGSDAFVYWTPQKVVANAYAGYLKRRIPIAQVIITEVEFSDELAASSVDLVSLWGTIEDSDKINPFFQEYTWSCRKGIDYRIPHYLKHLEDIDVITSNILSHKHIGHRQSDSWKEIQPSDLPRVEIDGEDTIG